LFLISSALYLTTDEALLALRFDLLFISPFIVSS
jgi:hypothetical protein